MKLTLLIGFGGFMGTVARYSIGRLMSASFPMVGFPLGTFLVNLLGSFFMGIIVGYAQSRSLATEWQFFLMTGICGGFTTFSALSLDSLKMLQQGAYYQLLIYILGSLFLGVLLAWLGWKLCA